LQADVKCELDDIVDSSIDAQDYTEQPNLTNEPATSYWYLFTYYLI